MPENEKPAERSKGNTTRFGDLPVGTRFVFRGTTFTKIALNMTEDEQFNGNIFMDETVVEVVGAAGGHPG